MLMVIPNEGKVWWLDRALRPDLAAVEDWLVSLYTNDYTPDDDSTTTSFTQPTFAGGEPYTLPHGNWGGSIIVANVAVANNDAPPFWTNTDTFNQLCYGWFALSSVSELVVAAQRFDTPRDMTPHATEFLDPFDIKLKTFA